MESYNYCFILLYYFIVQFWRNFKFSKSQELLNAKKPKHLYIRRERRLVENITLERWNYLKTNSPFTIFAISSFPVKLDFKLTYNVWTLDRVFELRANKLCTHMYNYKKLKHRLWDWKQTYGKQIKHKSPPICIFVGSRPDEV